MDSGKFSPKVEGRLTANRIRELQLHPVQGHFDTAHLKEIHRTIFQDIAYHLPGELRPDSSRHMKTRELEGESTRYIVAYAGAGLELRLNRVLGELQGGDALRGLPPEQFAERMGKLYGDLDHIHPFSEGNSRTLREFTRELALHAGYELDWHSTGVDAQARDRLYVARDVAVYQRQYPGLNDDFLKKNDRHHEFANMHHANHMLKLFGERDRLETIIRDNLTPHLQVQQNQQSTLKGVSAEVFAQMAAQRLSHTVLAGDLSPAQVREAAQQLAAEGERRINLNVITEERLNRDMQAAKEGQTQGFERLFQEAADPATVKLMQRAMYQLERHGHDPQQLYLTAARPGQQYEGHLEVRNVNACVVRDAQGHHLVTNHASLKGAMLLEDGRVQFTAQSGQQRQHEMEM